MEQTKRFENIYEKIEAALSKSRIILLTHMPKENWTERQYNSNWIYVNGHTHRNDYVCNEEETIYADNQVGYYTNSIGLKHFRISLSYDIFKYWEDGIYEITRDQYLDFNRGLRINMTFNQTNCIIHMLKNSGLYCFIYERLDDGRLFLLDGGLRKKLHYEINYYFTNLIKYSDAVKAQLNNYNTALKSISKSVKSFGGVGSIHGCIIDIDYFNHIYLNPNDGKITPYYATSIVDKFLYKDIRTLLLERRRDLYQNYLNSNVKNELLSMRDDNPELLESESYESDTGIYQISRIMKRLQYLINNNVVRVWYDQIIDTSPSVESKVDVFFLEGN